MFLRWTLWLNCLLHRQRMLSTKKIDNNMLNYITFKKQWNLWMAVTKKMQNSGHTSQVAVIHRFEFHTSLIQGKRNCWLSFTNDHRSQEVANSGSIIYERIAFCTRYFSWSHQRRNIGLTLQIIFVFPNKLLFEILHIYRTNRTYMNIPQIHI